MNYAFKPVDGDWILISQSGTMLPGAGELGEDVVMSHAFVASLSPETRDTRGLIEVVEVDPPEGAVDWAVGDVDGLPTQVWTVPAE